MYSLLPVTGFAPKFVSYFDEEFNHISKQKQMYFHFHDEKQQVVRSYNGSHRLVHANPEEISQSMQAVHSKLDLTHNLVQISMEHDDPDGPDLMEIRSCGLHVLYGAYRTAQKAADWNLDKLLKLIFKLSPAQRGDYLKVNELLKSHESKSVAYLFPQKLCGHRWIENGKALKRPIELHSYFKRYFSYLKQEKKIPHKDDPFSTLLDKMGFPLHLATLKFSLVICREVEPFLTFFKQNDHWQYFCMKI